MTNIVAFAKPTPASIAPDLRAAAVAFLLRERDAVARQLAWIDADLAEITGRNKENAS